MKFLDENIIVTVNNLVVSADGLYQYKVFKVGDEDTLLFVGNTFLKAGLTSKSIDITDIVSEQRWIPRNIDDTDCGQIGIYLAFKIGIRHKNTATESSNWVYSTATNIVLSYRYPNMSSATQCYFPVVRKNKKIQNLLQGTPYGQTPALIPHIPYSETEKYGLPLVLWVYPDDEREVTISMKGKYNTLPWDISGCNYLGPASSYYFTCSFFGMDADNSVDITRKVEITPTYYDEYDDEWISQRVEQIILIWDNHNDYYEYDGAELLTGKTIQITLSKEDYDDICNDIYIGSKEDGAFLTLSNNNFENYNHIIIRLTARYDGDLMYLSDIYILSSNENETGTFAYYNDIKFAQIDECADKYYLLWQDRMGGFQSQGFDKVSTYSESMEKTEISRYDGTRVLSSNIIQPKWSINSGWVAEEFYPIYESIYTSPFLVLYDYKADRAILVIVTETEYTEKNYENQQGRMFNITLNLEAAKKQNITY